MFILQATKVASAATKKTKELGQTVNDSVIKPTKEKVNMTVCCTCVIVLIDNWNGFTNILMVKVTVLFILFSS